MRKLILLSILAFFATSLANANELRLDISEDQSDQVSTFEVIDFGSVRVYDTRSRSLRLSNNGDSTIDGLELGISGEDFSGQTDCTDSIEPGESCVVRLSFRPRRGGSHYGTFYISTPSQDDEIDLYGFGVND